MIAVINYGMGNLRSVQKAFENVGFDARITNDRKVLEDAEKIVLPGVGAFKDCMKNLTDLRLDEAVISAINKGKPFLGICLGLQLLFEESDEFGLQKGLGLIKGRVVRFEKNELKVPHMGWNQVRKKGDCPLFKDIRDNSYFYFVHSYYVEPTEDVTSGVTEYGVEFTSSIHRDNIFACQFHPEKSQEDGLKILKAFGEIK